MTKTKTLPYKIGVCEFLRRSRSCDVEGIVEEGIDKCSDYNPNDGKCHKYDNVAFVYSKWGPYIKLKINSN